MKYLLLLAALLLALVVRRVVKAALPFLRARSWVWVSCYNEPRLERTAHAQ